MKRSILIIIFLAFVCKSFAQKSSMRVDTLYYLLDTSHIPINDRIWDIGTELPFKFYTLNCPCLAYNQNITFINPIKDKGKFITHNELNHFNLSTISTLIISAKKFVTNNFKGFVFFIIEPDKKSYLMHKVGVAPPHKPYISDDGVLITSDTIKKE